MHEVASLDALLKRADVLVSVCPPSAATYVAPENQAIYISYTRNISSFHARLADGSAEVDKTASTHGLKEIEPTSELTQQYYVLAEREHTRALIDAGKERAFSETHPGGEQATCRNCRY